MQKPLTYSAAAFEDRVHKRLAAKDREVFGDHTFNPELSDRFERISRQPAAVLVPVIDRANEATVLLTRRSVALTAHSGQVAFPGGKIDESDSGPEAAALREAQEEIGLEPKHAQLIGNAPDYLTGSGYTITPVLARIDEAFTLQINPDEVEEAFEVPLSFLMDPRNHVKGSRIWEGVRRFYFEMPYERHYIWGVTAGIVRVLYCQLYAPDGELAVS